MNRDFHRLCRVLYRAMRRKYGVDKVQDECLRVFKVLYPDYYRAKQSDDKYWQLSDVNYSRLEKILMEWIPEDGVLRDVICHVLDEFDRLMTREEFISFCEDCMVVVMRIRKLTPRECGHLMGVSEKDLDIMLNCGISKSSLYKLFGNSIVVDVLFHIFRKLFVETEPDMVKGEVVQLSLF